MKAKLPVRVFNAAKAELKDWYVNCCARYQCSPTLVENPHSTQKYEPRFNGLGVVGTLVDNKEYVLAGKLIACQTAKSKTIYGAVSPGEAVADMIKGTDAFDDIVSRKEQQKIIEAFHNTVSKMKAEDDKHNTIREEIDAIRIDYELKVAAAENLEEVQQVLADAREAFNKYSPEQ